MSNSIVDIIDVSSTVTDALNSRIQDLKLRPIKQTLDFDSEEFSEESEFVFTIRYKKRQSLRSNELFNLNTKLHLQFQPPQNVFEPQSQTHTLNCILPNYLLRILQDLSIYFDKLDWNNMIIAGEYILGKVSNGSCLSGCHCIDIIVYGENTKQTVQSLLTHFNQFNAYYSVQGQDITIIIPEFDYDIRIIQLFTQAESPLEILSNFAIGCYQMCYDGKDVWATKDALYDLVHNMCTFKSEQTQINKVQIYKALRKNLNIRIDPLVWECFNYCKVNPNDQDKIYKKRECPAIYWNPNTKYNLDLNTLPKSFHEMMINEMTKTYLIRKLHKYAKEANLIPAIKGYYCTDTVFYRDIESVSKIVFIPKMDPVFSTGLIQSIPQYQRNLEDFQCPLANGKYCMDEISTQSFEKFLRTSNTHYELVMKKYDTTLSVNTFEQVPHIDILIGPGKIINVDEIHQYVQFIPTSSDLKKINQFCEKVRIFFECPIENPIINIILFIDVKDTPSLVKLKTYQLSSSVTSLWCKLRVWKNTWENRSGISLELTSIVE